jgi:ketosteroid isomerase-like protein
MGMRLRTKHLSHSYKTIATRVATVAPFAPHAPFHRDEMTMKTTESPLTRRARLLGAGAVLVAACSSAASAPFTEPALSAFMRRFEQATSRFINGDNAGWLAHASRRPDATIMGAWGAYEAGWAEVGPRYDWAAARFKPSGATLQVEYLAHCHSGELAYTVAIERSTALVVGQDRPRALELRVTHVFRKEDGAWKLMHRHADPLITKTAPAATFAR